MNTVQLPVYNKAKEIVAWTQISKDQEERVNAGSLSLHHGYVRICINGKNHPLAHFVASKPPKGMYKDHINGDKLNNTCANLRDVTPSQNAHNLSKRKDTSSKYIGVCKIDDPRANKKWSAHIKINAETLSASFDTEIEAARWRTNAALYYLRTSTFCPKIDDVLTKEEFLHPTKPIKVEKLGQLPRYVYAHSDSGFNVAIADADGKKLRFWFKDLESATKKAKETYEQITIEKRCRHLKIPIIRNLQGLAVIVLTLGEEVLVDENCWHEIAQYSWRLNNSIGYPMGSITGNKAITLHQFCWELYHPHMKVLEGYQIDHDDRNKLNCLSTNLVMRTISQNNRNKRKLEGVSSKFIGVSKRNTTWRSYIKINFQRFHIGSYLTEEQARDSRQFADFLVNLCYIIFPPCPFLSATKRDSLPQIILEYFICKTCRVNICQCE